MKNNSITISTAIASALNELNLERSSYSWIFAGKSENYYEFIIYASCMKYTAFVDDKDGIVVGIDSEPYINLEYTYTTDNNLKIA